MNWNLSFSNLILGIVLGVYINDSIVDAEFRMLFAFMALMTFLVFVMINISYKSAKEKSK